MKKILFVSLMIGISFIGLSIFAANIDMFKSDTTFPYKQDTINSIKDTEKEFSLNGGNGTEDLGKMMAKTTLHKESLLNSFLNFFGFNDENYEGFVNGEKIPKAIIYVKSIINLLLALLSLVALIILIYTFYLMFFSDESSGIEKVKKNLKGILIALLILGLSWSIVSFIFNFYQKKILSPQEQDLTLPSQQYDNGVSEV